jgi:hypothetical protein
MARQVLVISNTWALRLVSGSSSLALMTKCTLGVLGAKLAA